MPLVKISPLLKSYIDFIYIFFLNFNQSTNFTVLELECISCIQCLGILIPLDPGGGEVLRFELDRGVPLEPQNPYPSLRVILAEKDTHF